MILKPLIRYLKAKSMTLSNSNKPAPVSNKVANFNQLDSHEWDFDEIEKLEREYIERKLNGGG